MYYFYCIISYLLSGFNSRLHTTLTSLLQAHGVNPGCGKVDGVTEFRAGGIAGDNV